MFLLPGLLLSVCLLNLAAAIPAPTVITTTTHTTVTSCSCTSKSTSKGHTYTSTLQGTSLCSKSKIQPTCKTTTSTLNELITTTVSTPTSTSKPTTTTTSKSTTKSSISTSTSKPTTTTTSKPTTTSSTPLTSTSKTSTSTSTSTFTSTSTSASSSATPVKDSGKRGLAYNDPTLTQPFSLSGQNSKVSWAYNWYSYPYTSGQTQSGYNPVLSFVPMLWSTADVLTSVWSSNVAASKTNYGTTAVIAFNEPDGCGGGQACMNVSSAVAGYQQWMDPLAGSVLLGAPAVTNGVGTGIGLDYLSTFIQNCTGCHIDFVPIHWYGDASQTSDFETYIGQAYTAGGNRPLWVTEFGTTSGTAQPFLQTVEDWMDGSSMVAKYAWFMDEAGNLINTNSSGMSPLGVVYNSG